MVRPTGRSQFDQACLLSVLSHRWQEQLELGHRDMHGLGQATLGLGAHTASPTAGTSQLSLQGPSSGSQREGYNPASSTLVQLPGNSNHLKQQQPPKTLVCLLAKLFMLLGILYVFSKSQMFTTPKKGFRTTWYFPFWVVIWFSVQ